LLKGVFISRYNISTVRKLFLETLLLGILFLSMCLVSDLIS